MVAGICEQKAWLGHNSHCSSGSHICGCPSGPQVRLKTRRPSLLPLNVVHCEWRGGQFGHGGMVAASLGNGGPDVCWDPRVATFGACGMARLCSRVKLRRRARLGGFGGTPRATMGCRAVLHPQFFCELISFDYVYLGCQSLVFDILWRVAKKIPTYFQIMQ